LSYFSFSGLLGRAIKATKEGAKGKLSELVDGQVARGLTRAETGITESVTSIMSGLEANRRSLLELFESSPEYAKIALDPLPEVQQ
jgi:hypothetical protein